MDNHRKRIWIIIGLLSGIILTALLFFMIRRQINPNNLILAQMEQDFSQVAHPADSTLVDEFSGWGNFSAHRQIYNVQGDYCDFWVFELQRYPGEPLAILEFYQAQGIPINVMFVEAVQGSTFQQTHQELGVDSYGDTFVLDFLEREYLWRFPAGLHEDSGQLYFVYFLRTNVEVGDNNGC